MAVKDAESGVNVRIRNIGVKVDCSKDIPTPGSNFGNHLLLLIPSCFGNMRQEGCFRGLG